MDRTQPAAHATSSRADHVPSNAQTEQDHDQDGMDDWSALQGEMTWEEGRQIIDEYEWYPGDTEVEATKDNQDEVGMEGLSSNDSTAESFSPNVNYIPSTAQQHEVESGHLPVQLDMSLRKTTDKLVDNQMIADDLSHSPSIDLSAMNAESYVHTPKSATTPMDIDTPVVVEAKQTEQLKDKDANNIPSETAQDSSDITGTLNTVAIDSEPETEPAVVTPRVQPSPETEMKPSSSLVPTDITLEAPDPDINSEISRIDTDKKDIAGTDAMDLDHDGLPSVIELPPNVPMEDGDLLLSRQDPAKVDDNDASEKGNEQGEILPGLEEFAAGNAMENVPDTPLSVRHRQTKAESVSISMGNLVDGDTRIEEDEVRSDYTPYLPQILPFRQQQDPDPPVILAPGAIAEPETTDGAGMLMKAGLAEPASAQANTLDAAIVVAPQGLPAALPTPAEGYEHRSQGEESLNDILADLSPPPAALLPKSPVEDQDQKSSTHVSEDSFLGIPIDEPDLTLSSSPKPTEDREDQEEQIVASQSQFPNIEEPIENLEQHTSSESHPVGTVDASKKVTPDSSDLSSDPASELSEPPADLNDPTTSTMKAQAAAAPTDTVQTDKPGKGKAMTPRRKPTTPTTPATAKPKSRAKQGLKRPRTITPKNPSSGKRKDKDFKPDESSEDDEPLAKRNRGVTKASTGSARKGAQKAGKATKKEAGATKKGKRASMDGADESDHEDEDGDVSSSHSSDEDEEDDSEQENQPPRQTTLRTLTKATAIAHKSPKDAPAKLARPATKRKTRPSDIKSTIATPAQKEEQGSSTDPLATDRKLQKRAARSDAKTKDAKAHTDAAAATPTPSPAAAKAKTKGSTPKPVIPSKRRKSVVTAKEGDDDAVVEEQDEDASPPRKRQTRRMSEAVEKAKEDAEKAKNIGKRLRSGDKGRKSM